MAIKARELRYAVDLDAGGAFGDEEGVRLEVPTEWTPEHLLLAALVRCSLTSLSYHAKQAGLAVGDTSGSARGMVTKRESDERYAFVEAHVELVVALEVGSVAGQAGDARPDRPRASGALEPEPDDLADLLANAERDCFISASLTVKPQYRWTVNGRS